MDCEKLITLVQEHPELYNTNHPDYMRTRLKDEIWGKIGDELFLEGAVVKDKWVKLRDNHREALRRQKKKSGQKAEFSKPWTYQKQMEFLLPFMKNRSTTSSVDTPSVEITDEELESPSNNSTNQDCKTGIGETERNNEKNRKQKRKCYASDKEGVANKFVKPSIQHFLGKGEQRVQMRDELSRRLIENKVEKKKDALHSFFMAMYMVAKELPPIYQRQIRNQIFQAVTQAEENYEFDKSRNEAKVQSINSESTRKQGAEPITI